MCVCCACDACVCVVVLSVCGLCVWLCVVFVCGGCGCVCGGCVCVVVCVWLCVVVLCTCVVCRSLYPRIPPFHYVPLPLFPPPPPPLTPATPHNFIVAVGQAVFERPARTIHRDHSLPNRRGRSDRTWLLCSVRRLESWEGCELYSLWTNQSTFLLEISSSHNPLFLSLLLQVEMTQSCEHSVSSKMAAENGEGSDWLQCANS